MTSRGYGAGNPRERGYAAVRTAQGLDYAGRPDG
jgi:hypothetical protein